VALGLRAHVEKTEARNAIALLADTVKAENVQGKNSVAPGRSRSYPQLLEVQRKEPIAFLRKKRGFWSATPPRTVERLRLANLIFLPALPSPNIPDS
jgi:hypothetical protein